MSDEIFPRYYESWRHCITVKCGIELSEDFIKERLNQLTSPESEERATFIKKYGEHWTNTVIGYFKRAQGEQ